MSHEDVKLVRRLLGPLEPRPKGSDAEASFTGAPVWTVRDRKVARIEFYWNRDEGLKAAGLEE